MGGLHCMSMYFYSGLPEEGVIAKVCYKSVDFLQNVLYFLIYVMMMRNVAFNIMFIHESIQLLQRKLIVETKLCFSNE